MKQWIIFTDLDGSLLDHDNYCYDEAKPVLANLKRDHIPVIFTTSKTRAEVLGFKKEMKNQHPFIVENGAAILIPNDYFPERPEDCIEQDDYWVYELSLPREHWLEILDCIKPSMPNLFNHFSNMSIKEICQATGLSTQQAELANTREYSEPIKWLGSETDKQVFIEKLESLGGHVLQGGRFLNLSGDHCKGKAMAWLIAQFRYYSIPSNLNTLALGDSQNDVSMLELSDYACLIRSPSHAPPKLNRKTSYLISEYFGPKGWAQGVNKIIYS